MEKPKIIKNRSDAEMFKGYKEELTFENSAPAESENKPLKRTANPAQKAENLNTAFFTPELQQQVGKALLDLKLKLFKEGIVDYIIKVTQEDKRIILTAVEAPPKAKSAYPAKHRD